MYIAVSQSVERLLILFFGRQSLVDGFGCSRAFQRAFQIAQMGIVATPLNIAHRSVGVSQFELERSDSLRFTCELAKSLQGFSHQHHPRSERAGKLRDFLVQIKKK